MLKGDFKKENVRKVILDDFSRALAWTGMLASSVDNSPDDEEEPHRTFDFRTDELLKYFIFASLLSISRIT
jgi:hypothetical protein